LELINAVYNWLLAAMAVFDVMFEVEIMEHLLMLLLFIYFLL